MSESLQLPNPNAGAAPIEVLLLTVPQAAQALQLSTRTIENLIASGQLKSLKVGGTRRIFSDDLRDFARVGAEVIER